MRIVIDARISGTSTGRYVDKLIEYLAKEKTGMDFVILTRNDRLDYVRSIAPDFEIVESNFPDFSTGEQIGLNKQLRAIKADLVHFPMVQQPLLYTKPAVTSMLDLTTIKFKNPSKNKIVFATKQAIYKYLNRVVARRSNQIITITDYIKDELVKTYKLPKDKLTTTYCAADKITDKSEALPYLTGQKFIMYLGRPQPHKNLGRLMDAFKTLLKDFPDLKLVLAGKKDVLFLQHEKRAGELGLSDSIIFTDFVSEGQLRWLYENCAAYVFPSLSEGFGLPGLEAMIHGAPVVSSNATCLPEVYGDAAHYFDPLDINDMAKKISDVLTDTKLRKDLIDKGHAQAAKYSWKRMAEQTLEVYKKALEKV